ncbi:MAG TPA: hypothetical protein VGP82_10105, partial [Ktedonobacterales bacterium]|nr:hypothetical protein [Ktedonobacterales bacterium]
MRVNNFTLKIAVASGTAILLAAGIAGVLAHGSTQRQSNAANPDPLAAVRAATGRYHTLSVAEGNGYSLLKDKAGIACIANPGVGAMGVHYVNGDLVKSGQVEPSTPQALVYAPAEHGQLRLVAVEYVVFQEEWDATHHAPPVLFGQSFMVTPDGNRFGLPAFYSLHAWIWKANPAGMFSMWNSQVSCASAAPGVSSPDPTHHVPVFS